MILGMRGGVQGSQYAWGPAVVAISYLEVSEWCREKGWEAKTALGGGEGHSAAMRSWEG